MNNSTIIRWRSARLNHEDSQMHLFPELRREAAATIPRSISRTEEDQDALAAEEYFRSALCHERKRTERTGDPFVLVLINVGRLYETINPSRIERICDTIQAGARDTDIAGWYQYPECVGVIYTALRDADRNQIRSALFEKIEQSLGVILDAEEAARVSITFHFFPENYGSGSKDFKSDETLYPDLFGKSGRKRAWSFWKRLLDIVGSLFGILLCLPCFLIIPVLIKLTSKGPVLFKQRRIGQFGREFNFLKFRSMFINNDPQIHQEYVRRLIDRELPKEDKSRGVFKIVNDPRVTPVGRFLRKTSLDEIPQFLNVLKGDMSLVGPRPPIPYEFVHYRYWHRRRVIEVRPGITGLWQVTGRSKTTFDEMVRLDIQYIRRQSIWLDLKIIFRTPLVLISGDGAY
jgi:lipopolysaccharide/colanic/teichoic acid biosynthesis glycosyltransferase